MSPSSIAGLFLALMTLIVAGLPLAMSLHLDPEGAVRPTAEQTASPAGLDRSTVQNLFDAEAFQQGLERSERKR